MNTIIRTKACKPCEGTGKVFEPQFKGSRNFPRKDGQPAKHIDYRRFCCNVCGGVGYQEVYRHHFGAVEISAGGVRGDNHLLSREAMADALRLSEALRPS